jgi:hypothetical protein
MPDTFRLFLSLPFPEKVAVVSLAVLVVVICVLQVIIANKNREIRRLRKDRSSLILATPPQQPIEYGEEDTKYSQKGDNVDNGY